MDINATPLVSIICLTYNHEPYIRECLDGFVMQKTDFTFEVIIHDDASTDGTTDIIKNYSAKYPDIIKPIIRTENQYSKHHDFSIIMKSCSERCSGKYIAFCEGDDYWTDPYKLQKQVDFLESHPDYGLCYTAVKRFEQSKNIFINGWNGKNELFHDLLTSNTIPTLTVILRADLLKYYFVDIQPESKEWLMGDYPIWLYASIMSKIKYIEDSTGVYRILPNSASHTNDKLSSIRFGLNYRKIANYFAIEYGNDSEKVLTLNNLNWIKFIQYCFVKNDSNARKIAYFNLWSKQNSLLKNLFFLIGLLSPKIVEKLYGYKLSIK